MQIGPKLFDYAIVGALFVFSQILIIILVFDFINYERFIETFNYFSMNNLPNIWHGVFAGLFATMMIIIVFAIGLILDQMGNAFIYTELSIFGRELTNNRKWAFKLLKNNSRYIGVHYKNTLLFLAKTKSTRDFSNYNYLIGKW